MQIGVLYSDLARADNTASLTYLLVAKVISYVYTKAAEYAVCNDNNDLASLSGVDIHILSFVIAIYVCMYVVESLYSAKLVS